MRRHAFGNNLRSSKAGATGGGGLGISVALIWHLGDSGFTAAETVAKTAVQPAAQETQMTLIQELRRILRTASYSLDGWNHAWREEKSLRQWLGVNCAGWLALALLRPPLWACGLVSLVGLLLLVLELVNSAIEAAVDHTSTDHHPLAKAAKDTGSAAVAVMGLGYVGVWGLTLLALF